MGCPLTSSELRAVWGSELRVGQSSEMRVEQNSDLKSGVEFGIAKVQNGVSSDTC